MHSSSLNPLQNSSSSSSSWKMSEIEMKNNDTQTVSEEEEVHASYNKFARVFREEDEIAVLEGLYVYWKCNGVNHEWKKYHEFIKDDLPHNFSCTQLSEKIRRLKLKFQSNWRRRTSNNFANAHESLVFDLSKKLWEQELISSSSSSTNTTPPAVGRKICDADADADADGAGDDVDEDSIKIATKRRQKQEFDSFPHLSALFDRFGFSASKYLTGVNKKKLRKLEKQSRKLIMQENQLLLEEMLLRKNQVALVVSGLKKLNS